MLEKIATASFEGTPLGENAYGQFGVGDIVRDPRTGKHYKLVLDPMESFPTESAESGENGGGGNRTREPFPTETPSEQVLSCGGKGEPQEGCPCPPCARWRSQS